MYMCVYIYRKNLEFIKMLTELSYFIYYIY